MDPPRAPTDAEPAAEPASPAPQSYIRSGHLLLSSRAHPVRLVARLWRYADVFGLGRREPGLRPRRLRRHLLALYAVVRLVLPTLPERRRPGSVAPEILPEAGHVALALRYGGYKVFDLDREIVTTLLPSSLAPDLIAAHITRAQEAVRHAFAPTVPAGAFRPEGWVDPDLGTVRRTMSQAVHDLQGRLARGGFRPAHDLSAHQETYRRVFYLEYVLNRLEKLGWKETRQGRVELLDEVEDWIPTFERFDRATASGG